MDTRKRWLIVAAATWDTAWKLAALWKAFRRRDFKWMPALIAVNSVGLLPIAYLFFIAKERSRQRFSPVDAVRS